MATQTRDAHTDYSCLCRIIETIPHSANDVERTTHVNQLKKEYGFDTCESVFRNQFFAPCFQTPWSHAVDEFAMVKLGAKQMCPKASIYICAYAAPYLLIGCPRCEPNVTDLIHAGNSIYTCELFNFHAACAPARNSTSDVPLSFNASNFSNAAEYGIASMPTAFSMFRRLDKKPLNRGHLVKLSDMCDTLRQMRTDKTFYKYAVVVMLQYGVQCSLALFREYKIWYLYPGETRVCEQALLSRLGSLKALTRQIRQCHGNLDEQSEFQVSFVSYQTLRRDAGDWILAKLYQPPTPTLVSRPTPLPDPVPVTQPAPMEIEAPAPHGNSETAPDPLTQVPATKPQISISELSTENISLPPAPEPEEEKEKEKEKAAKRKHRHKHKHKSKRSRTSEPELPLTSGVSHAIGVAST